MTLHYGGEKRPAKKCMKWKHLPGILSLSNAYYVCEYCHEVFDWIIEGEEIKSVIELGDWPGSERRLNEYNRSPHG